MNGGDYIPSSRQYQEVIHPHSNLIMMYASLWWIRVLAAVFRNHCIQYVGALNMTASHFLDCIVYWAMIRSCSLKFSGLPIESFHDLICDMRTTCTNIHPLRFCRLIWFWVDIMRLLTMQFVVIFSLLARKLSNLYFRITYVTLITFMALARDPEDGDKNFFWNVASQFSFLLSSHNLTFSFLGLRIMTKPSCSRSSHRTLFLYILVLMLCSVSLLCLFFLHGRISGMVSLGTLFIIGFCVCFSA
jgi:hypothetical protein